ncbi:MAG TPA: penicillin acylase family protein [Solirubrobacteraceae bacterium]|nr:penicillin acylase family protein [Solirubrobacteraceae bacterium]
MSLRRVLGGLVVAGCVLGVSAPAPARIIQATSILPPGESGFVSLTGVAMGTGSPHLYDQQTPFISFDRKDAMFNQSGSEEDPAAGVKIVRDLYGVPTITGSSDSELWWGAGYATAEDRLFELEVFRRATTGHLAEVLGASYIPMDIEVRRDFYTSDELTRMFSTLPADLQSRYRSYLNGINAWVDHVSSSPGDIPAEYAAVGLTPAHFSVTDLAAIGVYLARTTPNTDGDDLNNMHAIQASGPAKFDRILPLRIPGQIATIPRSSGLFPSVPGRTPAQERAALKRSYRFVRGLPLPPSSELGAEVVSGSLPHMSSAALDAARDDGALSMSPLHRGGSSMVAIGNLRTHHAFLFSGPELGFSAPEELYEQELHGPGLDVRGVTAPGAPVIAIGHNAHVAFGLTSGLSQTNALYAEHLVPGNPDAYYFHGQVRQMDCRVETFNYQSPPTSLLPPGVLTSPPQSGSFTARLCRTVHGPVQARVGNIAYARRYATWGREIDTLPALAGVDTARSVAEVDRALAGASWNENLAAADDRGHIGYWHPGLLPIRPKGWDERLPYPGGGQAEWNGLLPVAQRPHVIDPAQHWLSNWNNIPSQGWTTGNDPASERLAGPWFRVAWLNRQVGRVLAHPSFAAMNQMIHQAGSVAEQRPLAAPQLHKALHGARGPAAVVLRTILKWDGSYNETDSAGTVDPGVAAWQTLKDQLQAIALAPLGPAGQLIGGGEPNTEHVFDVDLGQAYALRTLKAAAWRRAAAATFDALAKRFGSSDPTHWRGKRALFSQSALGAEQPPDMPFFDRGTFEQVIELGS